MIFVSISNDYIHQYSVDRLLVNEDDFIMNQLGINTVIEMTTIGAGAPVRKKRFVKPKSSPRTSVASEYISKIIPKGYRKLPRKVWTPTVTHPFAVSKLTGRVIARWLPFVGWGLLAYDIIQIGLCVNRCNSKRR